MHLATAPAEVQALVEAERERLTYEFEQQILDLHDEVTRLEEENDQLAQSPQTLEERIAAEEATAEADAEAWRPVAQALVGGVETIPPDVVREVYPELEGATVFTGRSLAKWLPGHLDGITNADELRETATSLLETGGIAHADEGLLSAGVGFVPSEETWYYSFDGQANMKRRKPRTSADSIAEIGGLGNLGRGRAPRGTTGGESSAGGSGNWMEMNSIAEVMTETEWGSKQVADIAPQESLDELLQSAVDSPLHTMVLSNPSKKDLKQILLQSDIHEQDPMGRTALHYATMLQQTSTIKHLVREGADIEARDRRGNTPLLLATHRADVATMNTLLRLGASVQTADRSARTCIHWACQHYATDGLKVLLAHKTCNRVLVNKQEIGKHCTALHWAISLSAQGHASILLEYGADPGTMDRQGRTSMSYCIFFDEPSCLLSLLNHDQACVKLRDAKGRTPLHFCCGRYLSAPCLKILLKSKATDVNAADLKLRTPLHMCALYSRHFVAKALMQRGASVESVDLNKQSPRHYATSQGDVEMVTMFDGSAALIERAEQRRRLSSGAATVHGVPGGMSDLDEAFADFDFSGGGMDPSTAAAAGQWMGSARASSDSTRGPRGRGSDLSYPEEVQTQLEPIPEDQPGGGAVGDKAPSAPIVAPQQAHSSNGHAAQSSGGSKSCTIL